MRGFEAKTSNKSPRSPASAREKRLTLLGPEELRTPGTASPDWLEQVKDLRLRATFSGHFCPYHRLSPR